MWEHSGVGRDVVERFAESSTSLLRLSSPLGPSNFDFSHGAGEYYDIFYSDAQGMANLDGSYVSLEAVWSNDPEYGSMNIARMDLVFDDLSFITADIVASYLPGSICDGSLFGAIDNCGGGPHYGVSNAVDGNEDSFTRLGATNPSDPQEQIRLTLGFSGISPIPLPSTSLLLAAGMLGLATIRLKPKAL